MPKLKEIIMLLDEMAPFSLAEGWDNSGLQVGDYSQRIKKILLSLDPTIRSLEYASERNAQLLLTHHPLIFQPLSSIDVNIYPGDVVSEALKKNISIVSIHTNLDASKGGVSDILADLFGLRDIEALQKRDDSDNDWTGMGRIGYIPVPIRFADMIQTVKKSLGLKILRVMGPGEREIRRVAVVGGAGGGMVSLASKRGADLLITGDISHHDALLAQTMDLALIDGGHFQTEKVAMDLLTGHLMKKLDEHGWEVIIEVHRDEKGPMRYD